MAKLQMWTVYRHPKDYPDNYVARLFEVDASGPRPTDRVIVALSLATLRLHLERLGLVALNRFADDDPVVVETWL